MTKIRQMIESDIDDVNELCSQLGYPTWRGETKARFIRIQKNSAHALFIASEESDGTEKVVGFLHCRIDETLHDGTTCEVSALVVNDSKRGHGIGKKLIACCESWASSKNMSNVWLLSNIIRENAHKFYESSGYQSLKTARRFEKNMLL